MPIAVSIGFFICFPPPLHGSQMRRNMCDSERLEQFVPEVHQGRFWFPFQTVIKSSLINQLKENIIQLNPYLW